MKPSVNDIKTRSAFVVYYLFQHGLHFIKKTFTDKVKFSYYVELDNIIKLVACFLYKQLHQLISRWVLVAGDESCVLYTPLVHELATTQL